MPTLLRLTIVLLSCGVLFAGIALIALGDASPSVDGVRLAVGSLAVAALALPPMLAGSFTSYWTWDGSAARRLRILLVALIAVQVLGSIAAFALTAPAQAILLVVAAAAIDPLCIALGRAARRIEVRRPPVPDDLAELRTRILAGWRRGGIGAVCGLAVGAVIVALLLPLSDRGDAARLLLFAPAGAGIGASLGMVTAVLGLARRVRDLLGGDYSTGRRIGRAVNGKPEVLSDDEQERASRYAAIGPAWLRLQTTQTIVNSLAVAGIVLPTLLGASDGRPSPLAWLAVGCCTLVLVSVVATVVLRRFQTKRFERYAEAHPLAA